jgi:hypothetical protein
MNKKDAPLQWSGGYGRVYIIQQCHGMDKTIIGMEDPMIGGSIEITGLGAVLPLDHYFVVKVHVAIAISDVD